MKRALLALSLLAGCFSPSYPNGAVQCAPAGKQCPDNYFCATDNRCWENGTGPSPDMNVVVANDMSIPSPDLLMPSPPDLSLPGPDLAIPHCGSDSDCASGSHCVTPGSICFNPGGLSGLVLWLDPDRGLSLAGDGGIVSSWSDQSGRGNTAYADIYGGPQAVPTGLNGHTEMRFGAAGASSALRLADSPSLEWGSGPFAIVIVHRFSNSNTNGEDAAIYVKQDPVNKPYIGAAFYGLSGSGGYYAGLAFNINQSVSSDGGYNDNQWRVVGIRRDQSSLSVRINGQIAAYGPVTFVDVSAVNLTAIIGHNGGASPTQQLIGDVAELVAIKGATTDADLQRLDSYFRAKYGIQF
jgi:hypothetical protein